MPVGTIARRGRQTRPVGFERAEAAWLAADFAAGSSWLKDRTGRGHHMRLGSVGRAEVLMGALVLPGTSLNSASTPDHASLDVSDIEVVVRVGPDNVTPTAVQSIAGKWEDTGNQKSWLLQLGTTSLLSSFFSTDGATTLGPYDSTQTLAAAVPGFGNGGVVYVKMTRVASTGVLQYWWSLDGEAWTQLGANVATAAGAIFAGTATQRVGAHRNTGTGNPFAGRILRAIVRDGIGGTTVLDADFTTLADGTTSFTEATGKTVTVNQTAHADTNDPTHLAFAGTKYAFFPGVAGNNLSVPNPFASADYTITYDDLTTQVRTAAVANPLVFGNVDADFSAKKVREIEVRNTVGGVVGARFIANNTVEPYASLTDSFGVVWTINRAASGKKLALVDRPMFLFGTDDYLECADHAALDFAAGDSFTAIVALRYHGATVAVTCGLLSKRFSASGGAVAAGWLVRGAVSATTWSAVIDDGAAVGIDASSPFVSGAAQVLAGVRSVAADTVETFLDAASATGSADNTTATITNAEVLRIGRLSGAGTSYADMEFIGAAVFRERLTAATLAYLDQLFGTNA